MALYRQIYITFWSDPKVDDDFTPEDKYFYLYLLTNPHTNIAGCYEVSMKQLTKELGYNEDTVKLLLKRMEETHGVIRYDPKTKEVLLLNWYKYNWSKSPNFQKGIRECIPYIKSKKFRDYVSSVLDGPGPSETVGDRMGTSVTVTDYYTDTDCSSDDSSDEDEEEEQPKAEVVDPLDMPVISFTLNDGSEFQVTQGFFLQMQELYPAVDVMQELRNMKAWCLSNPKKRKTKSGAPAFINNWLVKEQNRGGRPGNYNNRGGYGNGASRGFAGVDIGE